MIAASPHTIPVLLEVFVLFWEGWGGGRSCLVVGCFQTSDLFTIGLMP